MILDPPPRLVLLAALLVTLGGAAAGLGPAAAAPRPRPRPRPAVDGVAELLQRHLAPPSLQHNRTSSSHTQQEAREFTGAVNESSREFFTIQYFELNLCFTHW